MKLSGSLGAVALGLAATLGMGSAQLQAQDPDDPAVCRTPIANCRGFDRFRLVPRNSPVWAPQMIRDSGRPIVPVFEGWFQNPDSTYTLSFGYISMNLKETMHIPVGPDNFIEPAQYNGGQPTFFKQIHRSIRRPWNIFMITVPKDFGPDDVVTWSLNVHGQVYTTPGRIRERNYIVEQPTAPARYLVGTASGYAPLIRFDERSEWVQGLRGVHVGPLAARVGRPLDIPVYVNAGETLYEGDSSWLYWLVYAGEGKNVTFSEEEVEIPLTNKQGVGTTSVTFSQPGRYVLLVQSIETLRNSFEYHCCWTNGWVEVNVTN